jgi:hypothetical protein
MGDEVQNDATRWLKKNKLHTQQVIGVAVGRKQGWPWPGNGPNGHGKKKKKKKKK